MARGILVELLSRPDGWEATADDMWRASFAKHGKASPGRRAFRAAFAELKEHGYLASERIALPNHKHGTTLAITDIPAGRPDVPHAGTSSSKNGLQNTGKKTSSSAAAPAVPHQDEEDLTAFGAFWLIYPKSRDRPATLAAWREARAKGVPAEKITDAAQAYARERAGEDARFTKLSANWIRDERYEDDYEPEPDANGRPPLRAVSGGYVPFQCPPASAYQNDQGF
jgi:hypothetical protein